MAKPFTKISQTQVSKSLARRFGPLADSLRDLLTKFGLRTNTVTLVKVQWSGGRRGKGTASVISEEVILPNPKVVNYDAVTQFIEPIGANEQGDIEVIQIPTRYTEEQLLGKSSAGEEIPIDTEFFWEIEFPRPDGGSSQKRRFIPRGLPTYKPGSLQWTIRLTKANDDRIFDGSVRQ